jgi:uncharacterized protein (DUF885 family)
MREGLRRGITIPRAALAGIERRSSRSSSPLPSRARSWAPFTRSRRRGRRPIARGSPPRRARRLRDEVVPAYRRFLDFMTQEYLPGCRETLAASELPDGPDYYAFLVRKFTTLDLTADQVHEIGLREVDAIRAEMETVIRKTGFTGSFDAFLTFLRTDPRFYPETAEALLKEASFIAKRMDAKLPSLFGHLPRQPYGVAPVPGYLAPKYTAGATAATPGRAPSPATTG